MEEIVDEAREPAVNRRSFISTGSVTAAAIAALLLLWFILAFG